MSVVSIEAGSRRRLRGLTLRAGRVQQECRHFSATLATFCMLFPTKLPELCVAPWRQPDLFVP